MPFYCDLIARHHMAMIDGNLELAMTFRKEAHALALRLNNGEPGILAGPEAPGCKLADLTKAPDGQVPSWGQEGAFDLSLNGMQVRIELDGLFGIGASFGPWMGFSAHAVEWDRPFLSETGYRSFLGIHAAFVSSLTPDSFVRHVLEAYISKDLKGRLVRVDPRFVRGEKSLTNGVKFDNIGEG